jgi:Ribonuclease G/E
MPDIQLLREIVDHLEELEEAWRRGVIWESAGEGGTRSNRNVDLARRLVKYLDSVTGEGQDA